MFFYVNCLFSSASSFLSAHLNIPKSPSGAEAGQREAPSYFITRLFTSSYRGTYSFIDSWWQRERRRSMKLYVPSRAYSIYRRRNSTKEIDVQWSRRRSLIYVTLLFGCMYRFLVWLCVMKHLPPVLMQGLCMYQLLDVLFQGHK